MKYSVIPEPSKFTAGQSVVFTLTRLCNIIIGAGCEKAADSLKKFLSDAFSVKTFGGGRESIHIKIDGKVGGAESYTLTVRENTIEIIGSDEAGAFYGVQSLRQLLFQGDLSLCEIDIEDRPRFAYRGFMLDCASYFFTKEAVFVFLEMMALHKLNHFHWYLSDDQGFRAQVMSEILLTEIGSYRSHTGFNKRKHEGYYTVEDMKEIVRYAHNLCIKVVPEINAPGHTVAMIAAYPSLSCFDRDLTVATHRGEKHDILCIGKESTFDFMKEITDELCETFTDGYFHLGGDAVPVTRWEICPHCRKRMEAEGISDADGLRSYYLGRMARHLKQKGKKPVIRSEKNVGEAVTRQLCCVEAPSAEGELIISDKSVYSLDLPYSELSLKKIYENEVLPEGVKEQLVIGAEACLYTEDVPTMQRAGYYTFPRLGAFSEAVWSATENKSYDNFLKKLPSYYDMLKGYGMEPATVSQAQPGLLRKTCGHLWHKKEKLSYTGLFTLADNAYVRKTYGENKNK